MGMAHPGTACASFELERLELSDGRLLVSGWWFGVRGMRFVRPALMADGRKVLATMEHKPWAAATNGSWTAAFPWPDGSEFDAADVMLVVAPSVEVPLDREAVPAVEAAPAVVEPEAAPAETVEREAAAPERRGGDAAAETLRDELHAYERRLDELRDELHETRAIAAERAARCRELEAVVARERRAAHDAEFGSDELTRAQAMAIADRDRLAGRLDEAVTDREAAVRTRRRMEAQRDAAMAERAEVVSERDELRHQRDDALVAHRALQDQLKGELASAQRAPAGDLAVAANGAENAPVTRPLPRARPVRRNGAASEQPSGVRIIPAARTVAAHLHRGQLEHGVTKFDMWAIRILGSVAALAFISLLVMILKAFFVF